MPRGRLKDTAAIEYLSILEPSGAVDEALEPELSPELLRALHRTMLLTRRLDERLLRLQREGRLGTFAPATGQEASQLGAAAALSESDWVVPSYRETAVMLWRGASMESIFLYNGGFNEGAETPKGSHDIPFAIPVGSQMLHAVGIGYGIRTRAAGEVVMTFFGDGATSQGDFHEAMNFASVLGTPVVFLCQNNQYAISVPRERQTASRSLAQKAIAYDMPGLQVDGNDILAVYAAAREAVERARNENAPTLIECVTYRLSLHTTADDPTKYRDEAEVEKWRAVEPLPRLQAYLKAKDILTDDDLGAIEEDIETEIAAAWQAAERRMKGGADPDRMFRYVTADEPAYRRRQRERAAARARAGKEALEHA